MGIAMLGMSAIAGVPRTVRGARGRDRRRPASASRAAVLLLLALLGAAPASAADWIYRVRPGDTVWDLARAHLRADVPWQRLQEHNAIADPARLAPGSRMAFPVPWLRVRPAKARVVAIEGAATASDSGSFDDARAVAADMQFGAGAALRTAPEASLTLAFADGSRLRLHGDSELRLDRLSSYGATGMVDTRMRLQRGRATSSARRSRGAASRFVVDTPGLMSSVRGTEFRVAVDDGGRSRSEVVAGRVAVSGSGREVLVAAGRGTVSDAQRRPIAPVRLLPAPDLAAWPAQLARVPAPLSWPAVDGARGYRLQVSASEDFLTLLQDERVEQPQASFRARAEGRVFARVRAVDDHGLEGLDATRALEVAAQPAPPFVIVPQAGDPVAGPRPRLRWTQSPDEALTYRVQVATSPDFQAPLVSETGLRKPVLRLPRDVADGDYYWRVGATDAQGREGPFGDPVRFTVRPAGAGPELGAESADGTLRVSWPATGEDGQRYRFQASRKADFAAVEVDRMLDEHHVELSGLRGGTWYLRVQAVDDDGFEHPFGPVQTVKLGCMPCRVLAGAGGVLLVLLAL